VIRVLWTCSLYRLQYASAGQKSALTVSCTWAAGHSCHRKPQNSDLNLLIFAGLVFVLPLHVPSPFEVHDK